MSLLLVLLLVCGSWVFSYSRSSVLGGNTTFTHSTHQLLMLDPVSAAFRLAAASRSAWIDCFDAVDADWSWRAKYMVVVVVGGDEAQSRRLVGPRRTAHKANATATAAATNEAKKTHMCGVRC